LEAGAGWPVVLLHAFPLSADMWRPQLERIPDGWRFIAPDLLGFGPVQDLSSSSGGRITMEDYARGVGDFLDGLEIDTAIIGGLSMGGYVTFAMFRLAPERFTGAILADTRAEADTAEGRAGRAKMRDVLAERGAAAIADQMVPKLLSEGARRDQPDLVAWVRRTIEAQPAAALEGALAAMMGRPDSRADLRRMKVPTLVIVGEADEITPPEVATEMQQRLTRAQLVTIPGAGHLSNLEAPDAFSRALDDFLLAHI